MVTDEIVVSTRKGLFTVVRNAGRWDIDGVEFLGDNVSLALTDARSGFGYAALDHGHFGVKLHSLTGDGWQEIAAPTYPQKPEGLDEKDMWGRAIPWSTQRIWALAAGGAGEPGVLWCGTLPGGLFDGPRAMGPPQAHAVDGRRCRLARHSLDHCRSA
jgi:hypothetical protein